MLIQCKTDGVLKVFNKDGITIWKSFGHIWPEGTKVGVKRGRFPEQVVRVYKMSGCGLGLGVEVDLKEELYAKLPDNGATE